MIDPRCIDLHLDPRRIGKRNLGAVCAYYQMRLDNAHDSADDAVAAARLVWRLAKTEPERIGLVDPHVLHSHQARWHRDREFAYADKLDLAVVDAAVGGLVLGEFDARLVEVDGYDVRHDAA